MDAPSSLLSSICLWEIRKQASKPHGCLQWWEAGATWRACLLKLPLIGFYSIPLAPALSLLNGREERRQEAADHSWVRRLGQVASLAKVISAQPPPTFRLPCKGSNSPETSGRTQRGQLPLLLVFHSWESVTTTSRTTFVCVSMCAHTHP